MSPKITSPDIWQSLFAASGDGLFELSADGRLLNVNARFAGWLGVPRRLLVGRPLGAFVCSASGADWNPADAWTGSVRLRAVRQDAWVSLTLTPVACGEVAAIGIVRQVPGTVPLDADLHRKADELDTTQQVLINAVARLAEYHEPDIGGHLERIRLYTYTLATAVGLHSEAEVVEISRCAVLHDVGKVAIPEELLRKPGRLTPVERMLMEQHTEFGSQFLTETDLELRRLLGVSQTFLSTARDVALHHHERYDGAGYPRGLVAEATPLSARIVAVADVYDALTSPRVYKSAWSHALAVQFIVQGSGTQFDPMVVEAFQSCAPVLRKVHDSMQDRTDFQPGLVW